LTRAARFLGPVLAVLLLLPAPAAVSAGEPDPPTTDEAASYATDQVLVGWRDPARAALVARAHGLETGKALGLAEAPGLVKTMGRPVEQVLAELRKDPNVAYAEPDYIFSVDTDGATEVSTNDPKLGEQYSLNRMRVRDAWSVTTGASNVIAVLDTGVQFNHPDLTGRLLTGYDFVNSDTNASDDNGHGTWVSGIIAARANDGWGIAGISWSDKILPVKIMNANGSGMTSNLVAGIRWAADHGAKVINMSIGGYPASTSVQDAVNYAWGKGVVLVGAAGNNRREETHYPASHDHVISVSATQADDEFTNWSSFGPKVDVSAPGGSVLTTNCEKARSSSCMYYGEHIIISGTSFATPNTAGVVALLRAKYPTWTPQQIVDRLVGTVDDLGYAGWDKYYGFGRVNAYRALGGSPAAISVTGSDGYESNNALSAARTIPLGTLASPNNYPAGDVDYFAVDIPRAGRLDVRVTAVVDTTRPVKSALPVDPIVELLTTGGSRLALVDNPSDSSATEVATINLSAPTRVVIRVSNWFPNGSKVPYTVRADYTDNAAPTVVARSPATNAADVNRYAAPSMTFSEAVTGVSPATFILRDPSTGDVVPASVIYDAGTRTAQMVAAAPLDALHTYALAATGGIKDTAGNELAPISWQFTTGEYGYYSVGGAAQLAFAEGTYTGYRFDESGKPTASRTYTLAHASGAPATLRGTLPGQSGNWFYVTAGVWSGYWLREGHGLGLAGSPTDVPGGNLTFSPTVRFNVLAGTHTGYRFDSSGRPTATRTYSLGSNSGASTSALRSLPNQPGQWFYVTNGVWAGYWLPASDVVYLAPDASRTIYDPPASLAFAEGTYTGYRFDESGKPTASRTYTLAHASGAPATLRGTLPGQSGNWFYVTAGVWSGYWLREGHGLGLAGSPTDVPGGNLTFSPTVRFNVLAGTHTGYRFDSSGRPTATRTYSLGSNSGASTSALRSLPNQPGQWFYVTNGVWAGYWLPASDVVYLAPG
jgi:thermitase